MTSPVPTPPLALAIDIGGTKVAAAIIDDRGTLIDHRTTPTPSGRSADDTFAAIERLLEEYVDDLADIIGIGIGSAGPIDAAAGTISPVNIPAWRQFPIVARIDAWLADHGAPLPVRLIGDGVAAALGEVAFGAAQGARSGLVIVVSTGIGGGMFVDGVVRTGHTGSAGHIGHIIVERHGTPCACGARGCLEAYASGPSMVRRARTLGWSGGDTNDGQALIAAYRAGEPAAVTAVHEGMAALGQAIADASTLVEFEVVLLGGGLMAAADVLLPLVRAAMIEASAFDFVRATQIDAAALGHTTGLIGAGAAVLRQQQLSGG